MASKKKAKGKETLILKWTQRQIDALKGLLVPYSGTAVCISVLGIIQSAPYPGLAPKPWRKIAPLFVELTGVQRTEDSLRNYFTRHWPKLYPDEVNGSNTTIKKIIAASPRSIFGAAKAVSNAAAIRKQEIKRAASAGEEMMVVTKVEIHKALAAMELASAKKKELELELEAATAAATATTFAKKKMVKKLK